MTWHDKDRVYQYATDEGRIVGRVDDEGTEFRAFYGADWVGDYVHAHGAREAVMEYHDAYATFHAAVANNIVTSAAGSYFFHGTNLGSHPEQAIRRAVSLGLLAAIKQELEIAHGA